MSAQERMNAYWTWRAPSYAADQLTSDRASWVRTWEQALPPSLDVLDVGTGSGYVAHLLAGLGHRVTGIDLAPGMLDRAREHSSAAVFLPGDAVDPPFAPASFDAVVSRYVVWTLRDPELAVRNWLRVLRPGGRLAVVDGAWFPDGLHVGAGQRFREAYDDSVRQVLPLAEGTAGDRLPDLLRGCGFVGVATRELTELFAHDLAHGVVPGHRPTVQTLTTAQAPVR